MALTQEQILSRVDYIGSTDAAAIVGLSRWKTPLQVWAEKTGFIAPEDISDKLQIKLGNKMESVVAELYEEETGHKVRRVNETIYHPRHLFLAANIDRRIVGQNAILEIKTTSAWRREEWKDDEYPPEYFVQVMHQLMVTGLPRAYLYVLIGNEQLIKKEVIRDEQAIKELERREVDFWERFVVPKIQPATITKRDGDVLDSLYPQAAIPEESIQLSDEANILIENLQGYEADLKNVQGLIDKSENELKAMLKSATRGETSLYEVAWKNAKWSGLNQKRLKEEQPNLWGEYFESRAIRKFKYKKLNNDDARKT